MDADNFRMFPMPSGTVGPLTSIEKFWQYEHLALAPLSKEIRQAGCQGVPRPYGSGHLAT